MSSLAKAVIFSSCSVSADGAALREGMELSGRTQGHTSFQMSRVRSKSQRLASLSPSNSKLASVDFNSQRPDFLPEAFYDASFVQRASAYDPHMLGSSSTYFSSCNNPGNGSGSGAEAAQIKTTDIPRSGRTGSLRASSGSTATTEIASDSRGASPLREHNSNLVDPARGRCLTDSFAKEWLDLTGSEITDATADSKKIFSSRKTSVLPATETTENSPVCESPRHVQTVEPDSVAQLCKIIAAQTPFEPDRPQDHRIDPETGQDLTEALVSETEQQPLEKHRPPELSTLEPVLLNTEEIAQAKKDFEESPLSRAIPPEDADRFQRTLGRFFKERVLPRLRDFGSPSSSRGRDTLMAEDYESFKFPEHAFRRASASSSPNVRRGSKSSNASTQHVQSQLRKSKSLDESTFLQ